MRSMILISAAALAVASCTDQPVAPNDTAAFAREIAGRVAGRPQSCIPTYQSTNLRVIDGQTLAYDQGATVWVNRLAARCPAIEPARRGPPRRTGSRGRGGRRNASRGVPGHDWRRRSAPSGRPRTW